MKNAFYLLGLIFFLTSCDCFPDENDTSSEGLKGSYSLVDTHRRECTNNVTNWNDLFTSFDNCESPFLESSCTLIIDEDGSFTISFVFSNDVFDSLNLDFRGNINRKTVNEDGQLGCSISLDEMGSCDLVNISWVNDILIWNISWGEDCNTVWNWERE